MTIKEVMRTNVVSVSSDVSATEAKSLMKKTGVNKLPVVDHGKLVGIVTKNDLLKAEPSSATTLDMYEISYLLSKLTVKKVMVSKVISVNDDAVVEEAAKIMIDNEISCLPVLKDGALVGIVTVSDLFHLFTEMFGARQKGARAVFLAEDKPGQLALVTTKISEEKANIISAVTSEAKGDKRLRITVKAAGIKEDKLKAILDECGFEIEDLRTV